MTSGLGPHFRGPGPPVVVEVLAAWLSPADGVRAALAGLPPLGSIGREPQSAELQAAVGFAAASASRTTCALAGVPAVTPKAP